MYKTTPSKLSDEFLLSFMYKGEEVEVNYSHLVRVYDELIRPVLDKVLKETTKDISRNSHIQLLPVGGFCNYILVRNQIVDFCSRYFNWGMIGMQDNVILLEEANREKAIAHGACLFSDNVIDLCYVAEYGIGMFTYFPDGRVYESYFKYCNDPAHRGISEKANQTIQLSTFRDCFQNTVINSRRGGSRI